MKKFYFSFYGYGSVTEKVRAESGPSNWNLSIQVFNFSGLVGDMSSPIPFFVSHIYLSWGVHIHASVMYGDIRFGGLPYGSHCLSLGSWVKAPGEVNQLSFWKLHASFSVSVSKSVFRELFPMTYG